MASVIIAEIGAAHGLHGAVKLKLFGHGLDSFRRFSTVQSTEHGDFSPKNLRRGKNDTEAIALFHEVSDRTKAESLRGTQLSVARDLLPAAEDDEYYHADLIGLAVHSADDTDSDSEPLGTVLALHNFGAGDILEFSTSDGQSYMHPFDQNFVPKVDLKSGLIYITGFDA